MSLILFAFMAPGVLAAVLDLLELDTRWGLTRRIGHMCEAFARTDAGLAEQARLAERAELRQRLQALTARLAADIQAKPATATQGAQLPTVPTAVRTAARVRRAVADLQALKVAVVASADVVAIPIARRALALAA